jgi:DNA-directed RNA polymerase specialized sigma24 family protein
MVPTSIEISRDPAEAVAQIADARRDRMLRIHRRRLRWQDLEDCYSQATLELVARSRRSPFASAGHVENALEQKFLSRIEDKRRAIGGRSSIEAALARSVPVDAPEHGGGDLEDRRAAVEQQVIARTELRQVREVISELSRDQQLVLASQVCVDMGVSEFCARYGWSVEKYRKVAQRARTKLRVLVDEYERGERCQRLEPDLIAMSAGVAEGRELARAKAHVANCRACARAAGDLDRKARSFAAVLPLPAAIAGSVWSKLGGILSGVRRSAAMLRHPLAETGYGGVGAAGGSMASIGALKVGIAVVCVAGAAGGYAVCTHLGVPSPFGVGPHPRQAVPSHAASARHAGASRRAPRRAAAASPTASAQPPRLETAGSALHRTSSSTHSTHSLHHRISVLQQTRREFGVARAHTANSSAVSESAPAAGAAAAGSAGAAPASPSQIRQTQAEFGFER